MLRSQVHDRARDRVPLMSWISAPCTSCWPRAFLHKFSNIRRSKAAKNNRWSCANKCAQNKLRGKNKNFGRLQRHAQWCTNHKNISGERLRNKNKNKRGRTTWNERCRDPESSRGPSDLQSDALPTELSRLDYALANAVPRNNVSWP